MGQVIDISETKLNSVFRSGIIAKLLNLNLKNVYTSSQSVVTFDGSFDARSRIGTSDEYYVSNDLQSLSTIQEYIDYVKGIYEGAGFTVTQTDTLELTLDSPTDKSYEGFTPIVESRANGFGPYNSALSADPDFSGGGVSVPQANILQWVGSNTRENTVPRGYAVKVISGTYAAISNPAVAGTGQFSVDTDAENTDPINDKVIEVYVGAVLVSTFTMIGAEMKPKANVIAAIISGVQGGWTASNPSGDIVLFTEPSGQEGDFDGDAITVVHTDITVTISGETNITGGSPVGDNTSFDFKKNGDTIQDIDNAPIQSSLPTMDASKVFQSSIKPTTLDISGDFALPVAVGTLNDFIINIYVFGDKI